MPDNRLVEIVNKMRDIYERHKQGIHLPKDVGKMKILSRILFNMEAEPKHPSISTRERGLSKLVDDAVIRDPVGLLLYRFGWENILPDYVREDWFIKEAREEWDVLGEKGKKAFKRSLMFVSDEETHKFLINASDDEWFRVYLDTEVVYNEKMEALFAVFSMSCREMNRDDYTRWANKFGIKLCRDYSAG